MLSTGLQEKEYRVGADCLGPLSSEPPLPVEQTKNGVASQSDPYTKVFRLGPLLGRAAPA